MAAKEQEIEAATKAVEDKLIGVGNLGVEICAMKEDLDDTGKQWLEDRQFATKEAEWDERWLNYWQHCCCKDHREFWSC